MDFKITKNKITYLKDGVEIGYVLMKIENNVLDIKSTFVDKQHRGKGIGDILLEKVVEYSKENGYKIIPTCSYAEKWFKINKKYKELLK